MKNSLTEPRAILLKRLYFRSNHRGCKETDLLLGAFAERHLDGLDAPMLAAYSALVEENDADIWDWMTGAHAQPPEQYRALLALMADSAAA